MKLEDAFSIVYTPEQIDRVNAAGVAHIKSVEEKEIEDLCRLLAYFIDWTKAEAISEITTWNDRKIRQLAQHSNGQIISGDKGYKLTCDATMDEITHAANRLRSQAKNNLKRAAEIEAFAARN
jgi:CHASE3 domain sensor protein